MKLKQLALLLSVSGFCSAGISQSTVFKCEDEKGIVSYLNEPQRGFTCQKTELGSIKNMATIKNEGSLPKSSIPPSAEKIKDFNEKITKPSIPNEADIRRLNILTKELEEEKKQLETMNKMIANVPDQSGPDASRLKEISKSHQKNIDSLEGQIAKITPVETKNLPLNIPAAEINKAIEEGKKLGNIHQLPTNQLIVDRVAVMPTMVAMKENKIDYSKQLENAKSAEEAVRMSNLALEDAKKQLEEIEKRALEAKEIYQKEQFEKQIKLAKENLKSQEENNQILKKDVFKIEDELLVIMKRQNLLLEERNFLWRKQQQLEQKRDEKKELVRKREEQKKIDEERKKKELIEQEELKKKKEKEKEALQKEEEEKTQKQLEEEKKKQIEVNRIKKERETLLRKNKELAEKKMKVLIDKKKVIEEQNKEVKNKQNVIDESLKKLKNVL